MQRSNDRRDRRGPAPPLDTAALERLALRYVERFATTEGKLADYLRSKVRERGWEGTAADPAAIAARMVSLGYVDDRRFAEARAAALMRRGLGASRVAGALRQAHVGADDVAAVTPMVEEEAAASALRLARRKRIGPFAAAPADRPMRERQVAQMVRAGHGFALARRIVEAAPGDEEIVAALTVDRCEGDEPC